MRYKGFAARRALAHHVKNLAGSASAAVQTALRTKEIADNTLVELQGQGQRLKVINADLHEVKRCCGVR